jgi:hypothetical protein
MLFRKKKRLGLPPIRRAETKGYNKYVHQRSFLMGESGENHNNQKLDSYFFTRHCTLYDRANTRRAS